MRQLKINNAPVETREAPLWWHKRGLSFTASGYGRRIPMGSATMNPRNPA